ncbi:solute:Na+ symporter, SSS family [Fodinibius roseus]|uniref:Solute:Na+ symporter, SSS family n=1 Tax=Fodinibius roseus TaxID=1194090 RepID=A0A1M5KZF1_9BACT|nr:sodium:solute symporter family protein [Fodinibius roseus]SHG58095.1 solute:Na+ symporter, SSS family [Fodinibius roseus]
MSPIDIIIVVAFLVLIFVVGGYFYKWISTPDDFYVTGRKLTPFILAATITATNVNVYSFVGQSGTAYQEGLSIIWHTWTGNMALVLSGIFIIPIFRRLRIRTIPEFLGLRYSQGFRGLVAVIWIFRLAFWLGIGIYAIAIAAQTITGVQSFTLWVFVLTGITVFYTILGGTWSVATTDALQFLLMLGGALILLPVAMYAVGGFATLKAQVPAEFMSLVPQSGDFNWLFLIAMVLLSIKWATINQDVLQRAFSSENVRTASKGMVLSGIITTPFALLWILPGIAAKVLYPDLTNFDNAVPTLIVEYFPPVVLGLMACGLLSAMMSTIDSDLNSIATMFTSDLYNGYFNIESSHRQSLTVARLVVLVMGLFIIGFSYLVPVLGGAVEANLTVIGILDTPLFVVAIIYGLLWKRANWQGAFAGYFAGAFVGVFVYLAGDQSFSLAILSSAGAALVVCPLVSLLTPPQEVVKANTIWDAKKPELEHPDDVDPFYIVPKSIPGKLAISASIFGLILYLIGAIVGSTGAVISSYLAVGGMFMIFIGGLVRIYVK